ncbi:hypothetical protein A6A05_19635 [Magnetospirillum moscoviense]|uniref:Uncharacterized protein n=1 Tax=Magnetospirillum moscoviense TaxID=1437059 RepID=A0A178MZZ9_9PROT|nr:hypothetical protein A6A05_19635 [Magnetospirillum moscoviense]
MLELCEETFNAPAELVGEPIIGMLVLAMAAWRDDRLAALVEDEVVEPISVIGAIRKDLIGLQSPDQIAGGGHIVLLAGAKLETYRQAECIDYGVEFGSEAASGAAKSLGLRSPLFRRAPAA